MAPQEIDPLLLKDRSTLMVSSSTSSISARGKSNCLHAVGGRKGITMAAVVFVILLSGAFGALLFWFHHRTQVAVPVSVPEPVESGLVEVTSDGDYVVSYEQKLTKNTTFAELAQLMLPPWYEASVMVMNDVLQPDSMDPSNVQKARKVLLTTRDLLDVFSPVFPSHSIWRKVRALYKSGYEKVGYYQDLDHAHIEYSPDLWEQRRADVTMWKAKFASYATRHDVLGFLQDDVTSGCYNHKESHLFWEEMDGKLPCGNEAATPSLQSLATVQLQNSLEYLETIRQYDTVLGVTEEETFHNFRKEIRSFLDEYTLFGFVLLPDAGKSISAVLGLLKDARQLLGDINNNWNAYHHYLITNKHADQQKLLAAQIEDGWNEFLKWVESVDLVSAIQSLIDEFDVTQYSSTAVGTHP